MELMNVLELRKYEAIQLTFKQVRGTSEPLPIRTYATHAACGGESLRQGVSGNADGVLVLPVLAATSASLSEYSLSRSWKSILKLKLSDVTSLHFTHLLTCSPSSGVEELQRGLPEAGAWRQSDPGDEEGRR